MIKKTTLPSMIQLLTFLGALKDSDAKSLDSYGSIGWAAQFPLDSKDKKCKDIWGESEEDDGVKGHVFVSGGWSVIVRRDRC